MRKLLVIGNYTAVLTVAELVSRYKKNIDEKFKSKIIYSLGTLK